VTLYDRYILSLALLLSISTIIFSLTRVSSLGLCFSIYLIGCLALTELFVHLDPKAKRNLRRVTYLLLAGFMALMVLKILDIFLITRFL
jgi:hypothetical protein